MTEDPNKKNQTPPSDVLKKLKEVRRKLQESLSEGEEKAPSIKTPQEKLDIIPGATETLARAAAEKERARLEKEMAAAEKAAVPAAEAVAPQRQLYKAGGEETSEITAKKAKAQAGKKPKITAARLASIQRRVRQKSSSVRTMGKGKRSALVIVLCFAFLPLVGSLQLNLIACEFKLDQFAIIRDQNAPAGELAISLPVHNPQFIPAFLGQVSLKIFDPILKVEVLSAATVSTHMINPYDTITLTLKATLNPDYAGEWLKDLLTTQMLNIQIQDLTYGGMTVPNEIIPVISLDISSLFGDLLGGLLNIEDLLSGFLGDMVKTAEQSTKDHIVRDLWAEAKTNAIITKAKATGIKDPSSAQFDDLLGSLGLEGLALEYLDVYETEKNFTLELTIGIELPGLEGMNLGPIIISYMNASLWTNNVDPIGIVDTEHKEKYKYELARLEMMPSDIIGDVNTGQNHGLDWGNLETTKDAAKIILDGTSQSILSVRLTIFKDAISGAIHPSAGVDWANPSKVDEFAALAKTQYPTWYFLNYLLVNGSLDVYINVARVDLELFGIVITHLPLDILDPIYLDGVLKLSELFSPFGIGFGDGIAMYLTSVTTGGLAFPNLLKSRYKIGPNALVHTAPITEDNLTDALESMIDLGAIGLDMNMIHESWGPTANLSLGISLPINNTLFDLHAGLVDTQIRLGTKLPDEGDEVDPTFFAILDLTSNGSNTIYLNGINSVTTIDASLVILKNETMAPYAAVFLRKFIEEFTLDAYLNVHLGRLVLFEQNMTLAGIDITLPLTFDLGDMVNDLVSGLIGDMIGELTGSLTGSEETNGTSALIDRALSNPLAAPYALPFVLTNPFAAIALGQPRSAQLEDIFGGDIGFTFGVESNPVFTSIDLAISGLSIDMADMGIPISLGLGYSSFEILGAVPNQFGGTDWNNMLELKLDNYLDLASTEPQSIIAHIRIYESIFTGGAICNFLDELLENGSLTMKLSGNTALNLSGIFLDDLDMSLELNKVETGLNFTDLINGLIGSLTGSAGEPAIDWGPVPAWWTGDASSLPFMQPLTAQAGGTTDLMGMLDMFVSINTDMLSIAEITETDWPYKNNVSEGGTHTGKIHLSIIIPITNHMMTLSIPLFEAELYNGSVGSPNTQVLARVTIDPQSAILRTNQEALVVINIDLIKSQALEDWLNVILSTFSITGFLSLNVSIGAFGCVVGPISVTNLSLEALGLDADMLTGLLEAVNPMNPEKGNPLQVLGNNPNAAQLDIMSLIGKFGLAWVEISPARWDAGAWDRNEQFPMMNVSLGIALQPAFNMSIDTADHDPNTSDLQLCDSKIFKAIYDLPNDAPVDETLWNTAVKYSKVADLFIRNTPVYFNNTYDGSKNQDNNYAIDPHKPYYLNNTVATRAAVCKPSYGDEPAGDYTWDWGTPSGSLTGALQTTTDYVYRKGTAEARALAMRSGTTNIPFKASADNLTGFWEVAFWVRRLTPGNVSFAFVNESYLMNPLKFQIELKTTEWTRVRFYVNNFSLGDDGWYFNDMRYLRFYCDEYFYLDDLNIQSPNTPSYISWGDEGVLDNDPEMVKDSTFNFVEFNLLMYNISHPSFAEAYPRALWRKLGGPYFTPIVYGKEYGGFPDHRVVYPSYFSPYANFMGGMINILGPVLSGGDMASAITGLISSIALNGSLTVNIFSMDLKINVGLPILGDLLGSMGTLLATALYRVMYKATNPLAMESPFTAQFDNLLGGLGSFPIIGLFYEIPIFGATERNNHIFCPQHNVGTGSNVNPWNWYYRNPYLYTPGLVTDDNPNAMNTENFYKDAYYDDFKVYVENWANSIGIENPYFESKHPLLDPLLFTEEERTYKEGVFDLRDPDSWALKYNGNRYGGTGRTRTNVLAFLMGVSLPLPVTVLGAYIRFLFDSPYQPCQYAPGGYIWINESLYLPQGPGWKQADGSDYAPYLYPWRNKTSTPSNIWNDPTYGPLVESGRDPRFCMYPSAADPHPVHFDANGKVIGSQRQAAPYADGGFTEGQIGNWMFMNIRLFEGGPVSDFLSTLMSSLLGIISGVASVVSANASLFGYEVYNIGGLSLPLGDHSPSGVAFCDQYAGGAANGSAWNMPAANGTLLPPDPEAPTWPPALPGFTPTYYMSDTLYLSMEDLFGDLLTMIVDLLIENLLDDINGLIGNILTVLLTGTLPFHINSFTINNPIPLPMWIQNIGIDIDIIINDMTIRLGVYKSDDIWTEFDTYPGQTNNPYDFSANPIAAIATYEPVTIPAIDIEINIPGGIMDLLGELLGGGLSLNIAINDILLYLAIPAEWDYFFVLSAASMLGDMVDLSSLGL